MKMTIYVYSLVAILLFLSVPVQGQTQMVGTNYYPAEFEFTQLAKVQSDETLSQAGDLKSVPDAALFADVGFERYDRRIYKLTPGGTLSIEVITLKDGKAAYSLLTLLGKMSLVPGPPGEFCSIQGGDVEFARGSRYVRIRGDAPANLAKRVAISVGNRIGQQETSYPTLVSHFPNAGHDASSVRYFLGPKSYATFAIDKSSRQLQFEPGMEIAQARYALNGQTGIMTLMSFPTHDLAEAYETSLEPEGTQAGWKLYTKRAGPLLVILEGDFDSKTANDLLSPIRYSYSIKWIYDKDAARRSAGTIWGVPMPILGTVVRSIFLVTLLCGFSLVIGVGFGLFRVWLRGYAPHNVLDRPERTEVVRLKIDEK
jgi:hypothetical protein